MNAILTEGLFEANLELCTQMNDARLREETNADRGREQT